ncbi:MAG TPA: DegQ family serine endoprotease [Planctomycetota bacterium]|nr:DegQ family serine endoprotease [Planctomycetota bacterium]
MNGGASNLRWALGLAASALLGALAAAVLVRREPAPADLDLSPRTSHAAEAAAASGAPAVPTAGKEFSRPFVASARAVMPAVVHIEVFQKAQTYQNEDWNQFEDDFFRRFFGQPGRPLRPQPQERVQRGQGSGVIVDARGYILTNNHVVGQADRIRVQLADKRTFDAKLVGADERSDVAVIKIEGKDLPAARLGDSGRLEVGEWVLAIGNPFGLDQTVTSGVVSALGRTKVVDIQNQDFIQTDAAINPGNSGGPLANLDGEVVGINTAIYSRSGGSMGIGFAIPINMARTIMSDLIAHGKVIRGWLGVRPQDVTEDMARALKLPRPSGALVAEVFPDSPGAEAGIQERDVIVGFNGKEVGSAEEFLNAVGFAGVGRTVELKLYRDGKPQTVQAKVAERTPEVEASETGTETLEKLGLVVRELTPEIREQLGLRRNAAGVVVVEVKPRSPAANAGFEPGVIIEEVNKKPVNSVPELKKALGADVDTTLLKVRYRGRAVYLALKMK